MIKKAFFSAVILAAVIGVMASQSFALMYYITLPDFRNMTPEEAQKMLRDKGYDAKIVEMPSQNYTQVGKIIKQDPDVGMHTFAEKPKNFVVTLYVGGKGGIVPSTLLMTEAAAIDALKKAGYVPKVEYYVNESQGMEGKVWKTDPAPYRNHPQGGTVVLQVAKPGQAMPDFIGKHALGVPQWVTQINGIKPLHLKATVVQDKTISIPQEDQKVYAQSPSAGTVLVQGSEIKVSAYKYVPPPPPPPPKPTPMSIMGGLVGKTEKEATDWLSTVGLKWSVNHVSAPQPNWGRVTAQSIPAGSRTAGPVVLTVGQK
jgi:beta-lactam-binding protein with PASTA domain